MSWCRSFDGKIFLIFDFVDRSKMADGGLGWRTEEKLERSDVNLDIPHFVHIELDAYSAVVSCLTLG